MPFLGTRGAGTNKAFGFAGAAKPNQVTGLTATDFGTSRAYNNGRIDLSWTEPGNNGATISGYKIERSTDNSTYSTLVASTGTSATTYSDTSLTSSQIYYYKISAINPAGTGDASTASSATATTVPQAPTIGTVTTANNGTATVPYTAGATGGKAVSVFTATSSPGSLTNTGSSPISFTTLTNGTAYTFTVTATNANGTSASSAASNSVTPVATYGFAQTFNASGTYTVPAGKTSIAFVGTGGGGGGRAGTGNSSSSGGSGGGGAGVFSVRDFATSGGTSFTITIGAGAPPNSGTLASGVDGGSTTIASGGTLITANGGQRARYMGADNAGGNASSNIGVADVLGNGGEGKYGGGPGGRGGYGGNINAPQVNSNDANIQSLLSGLTNGYAGGGAGGGGFGYPGGTGGQFNSPGGNFGGGTGGSSGGLNFGGTGGGGGNQPGGGGGGGGGGGASYNTLYAPAGGGSGRNGQVLVFIK